MLEQSRGRAGQPRETDLNALVRAYAGVAAEGEGAGARAVEVHVDESVGTLSIVPEDIGRVVLNLVTNALHAAGAHSAARGDGATPHVQVTTHGDRDHVEVRVRDNGGGIPEELRDHVFMPFFTTKPSGEGTGLGLSISQEIVAQGHGGTLTFTSREGCYTEFVMVLPREAPKRAPVHKNA
jgi:signal transduction histidine kinase